MSMLYLITYDIGSNKYRNKISKLLVSEGYERLQLSVFLGFENPADHVKIRELLSDLGQEEASAKFFTFPIPKNSIRNMKGVGLSGMDKAYLLGEKRSMWI